MERSDGMALTHLYSRFDAQPEAGPACTALPNRMLIPSRPSCPIHREAAAAESYATIERIL